MHPILLTLPLFGYTLEIPTYGVMLAVAFLIILKAAAVLARREGLEARDVVDLGFTVFLAGLVGAKLLLILLDIRHYLANPGDLLGTLRSAGVFYGGLLAAVPAGIWFARSRGLDLWKVTDIAGVCLPIGLTVGRLGCLAAGCCFGKPSGLPWAVTFTRDVAHRATGVPLGEPLHPTQLYLSLNALLLTGLLLWRLRNKRYDGQVFLWFVVLYGATRSGWETLRGDTVRGFLVPGWVSTSQAIGLASVVIGLALIAWRRRRAHDSA
jgi:phosphatidylglycerol:prolipoprotein diacylglycerol transferase